MIVSWVTMAEPGSSTVLYWSENSKHKNKAKGRFVTYKFYNYTSGYIHHCNIKKLKVCVSNLNHFMMFLFSWAFPFLILRSLNFICYFLLGFLSDLICCFVGSSIQNITIKSGLARLLGLFGLQLLLRLDQMSRIHLVS